MKRPRGDDGAILVLAVLFILVVGLIGGAVVAYAGTSLASTSQLQGGRAQSYAAESVVQVAIENVRGLDTYTNAPGYNGSSGNPSGNPCPSTTLTVQENAVNGAGTNVPIQVLCAVGKAPLPFQRSITFVACPASASASSCLTVPSLFTPVPGTAALVVASTLFSDLKAGCSGNTPASCFVPGYAVDTTTWVMNAANG